MAFHGTRTRLIYAAAAILLGACGFVAGFVACLHLRSASPDVLREQRLLRPGDAPPAVRAQVLVSLRAFQQGYIQRDPARLDAFMQRLFPADDDFLVLGTEGVSMEWARGSRAASELIRNDWERWGDFRFNVDNAIVWSSGDVAWVATVGKVMWNKGERPVRLTAILTRNGKEWQFRQVHFQWDDSDPAVRDILKPGTYLRHAR